MISNLPSGTSRVLSSICRVPLRLLDLFEAFEELPSILAWLELSMSETSDLSPEPVKLVCTFSFSSFPLFLDVQGSGYRIRQPRIRQ